MRVCSCQAVPDVAVETAATLLEHERELTELGTAVTEAQHGRGRVVLVEDEALARDEAPLPPRRRS